MTPSSGSVRSTKGGYVILFTDDLDSFQSQLRADHAVVALLGSVRAPGAPDVGVIVVGQLEIRPGERRVLCAGRPLELSQQEIDLLAHLAVPAGRARSFQEIIQAVWGTSPLPVGPTVVHSANLRLRRKLERAGARVGVESVRGYGLRLTVEEPTGPSR